MYFLNKLWVVYIKKGLQENVEYNKWSIAMEEQIALWQIINV